MRQMIGVIIAFVCAASAMSAQSFEQLKAQSPQGYSEIPQGTVIEGVIVSDYTSLNMGENPQEAWNKVDTRVSYCTAYIQNEEGTSGFRLMYNDIYDNRIPRFTKVRISLDGCMMNHETDPERFTIIGVAPSAVTVVQDKVQPSRTVSIAQLTDNDLFTYVTIPNVEFATKEGSYTNVNEYLVQKSALNAFTKPADLECVDVAGVYLKDGEGEAIFLPVNTSCYWRRRGT